MSIKNVRLELCFDLNCTDANNFTHLKLWVAVARHNLKFKFYKLSL